MRGSEDRLVCGRNALSAGLALAIFLAAAAFDACATGTAASQSASAEARVVHYLRDHLRPGEPLLVTQLYNQVFTQPDERKALGKLYAAFFRIPLFVAQYQDRFGKPPSLGTISQQFDLHTPGAADVLLRVMESDPRVPRFFSRDAKTGEITHVDVTAIRSDPHFGAAVERQLGGWRAKPAPEFKLTGLTRGEVDLAALRGKTVLLYVWFTGCPPCMKESPVLVALAKEFPSLTIVGANADRFLGLDYDDAVRRRYIEDHKIAFPVVHWTKESDAAYGGISIFPTLFLIDAQGTVQNQWVGFTSAEDLGRAVAAVAAGR